MRTKLLRPGSIQETVAALAEYGDEAKVMAGGTALMIMMRTGLVDPAVVISLDSVTGLDGFSLAKEGLRLGARATLRDIERAPAVATHAPLLAHTLPLVANKRIRHAATVGGNMAEADYASDPPSVLLALDACVEVTSARGTRAIAFADFFVDYYQTAIAPDELVTAVNVPPLSRGTRGVYVKYVTRSCEDRPCVGIAAVVATHPDGRCAELRVAVGAAGPRPWRLPRAETAALGSHLDEESIGDIAEMYAAAASPLSDLRGTAQYRRKMIKVFVRRAIRAAVDGQAGAYRA